MPTYVYRRADGTTFERFQRISDDALTEDPETGEPVERLVGGGAGLIFKGSGFYLTDYARKKTSGTDRSSDSAKSADTPAKKETKTTTSKASDSGS